MSQVQEASELVRLVAASDARVTVAFRTCIRGVDPSARVAPTPRHLPYGARSARRTSHPDSSPRRAAATRRSEESRPGVADSSDTRVEESLRQSPTHTIFLQKSDVSLRLGPTRPTRLCPRLASPTRRLVRLLAFEKKSHVSDESSHDTVRLVRRGFVLV